MSNLITYTAFLLFFLLVACSTNNMKEEKKTNIDKSSVSSARVAMKKNAEGNYRLFVEGEEFYVHGAGLEFGDRQSLADHGANSFRTWRTDNAKVVLDEALELGLMVMMGIEVGRERHGYDYDDEKWVAQQKEEIKKQVNEFKDHPALLGWGIGNELNLRSTNKKVWDAVNDLSIMIHEIDGNHPTTTMLAGIHRNEINYMADHTTDLDFISIQLYGDIINLQRRIADAGYEGPYLVTEWGAVGHWEVEKTSWGAPIEQTSTERAAGLRKRYEKAIMSDQKNCLGSYVFLWGQKQERTPTWYGLFTEAREESEAIDEMHYFWNNNNYPSNRAPQIANVKLNNKAAAESVRVEPSAEVNMTYLASDPNEDELTIRFEVLAEATQLGDGGDKEPRPESIDNLLLSKENGLVKFKAPEKAGAYRAFLYLLDGHNNAATVNIPFLVTE